MYNEYQDSWDRGCRIGDIYPLSPFLFDFKPVIINAKQEPGSIRSGTGSRGHVIRKHKHFGVPYEDHGLFD